MSYKYKCKECGKNCERKKVTYFCSHSCHQKYKWRKRGYKQYEGSKKSYFQKGHSQSNTGKTHFKKGIVPWHKGTTGLIKAWNKGKKVPKITGENHYLWKGGISATQEYHNFYKKQYKYRKRGATGSHTKQEWESLKKHYQHMCLCCKRTELEIELTEDHIIPLSKGGSNNIENIQPLCRSCNGKKINKTIDYREHLIN